MSNKSLSERDKQRSPINLVQFNGEQQYICDDCGIQLALYPSTTAAIQFPLERGPHYICPQCHLITDLSLHKPPGLDNIEPINSEPTSFVMAPEDKGDYLLKQQEYDPEPNEEAYLKNIGATLISKRVQV